MKTYKELRQSPRLDLAQVSPLPAPLTIYVEPTNVCNFGCQMCPESFGDYAERAGYYQHMPMEMFKKITSDIGEFGKVKSLKFYFEGEPLLNPHLGEMITWASIQHVAERMELTTNGSIMTPNRCRGLVYSGLDYIQVSIYSVIASDHERITGQSKFGPNQILANVQGLRFVRDESGRDKPFIHAKLMYDSEEGRKAFELQYREVADEISVQASHNWMGDVKVSNPDLVTIGEAPIHEKRVCPFPFYMMTIKANGDVSVCCVDWSGKLVIGNVLDESLKQIWNGERMNSIRVRHLRGQRDRLLACRSCDALMTTKDNLDSLSAEEYISRCQ